MSKKNPRPDKTRDRPPAPINDRERGSQAFARGDYSAAIAAWTKAAQSESSEAVERALAEAHFRRACQSFRNSPAQALEDFQTAADLVPEDAQYAYHVGLAYQRQGDLQRAMGGCREALRRDPYYTRAAYVLCLALAQTGSDPTYDPAWNLLTPVQRDRILPADDTLTRAMTEFAAGHIAKAETLLQHGIGLSPRTAHYYLGVIAWRRGESDEALAHWLAARAAGFDSSPLRHNLLNVYLHKAIANADTPTLLETVRTALKYAPDSPVLITLRQRAEFMAGNRAAESGDWQHALIHWLAARQSSAAKTPQELLMNLALGYERLERWSDAADAWRDVIRRRPRRGESAAWLPQHVAYLWRHIDTLYARAGDANRSTAALHYAIKAQPDDLTLRLALVKRYMENENWRNAEAAILRILELTPKHPEALALYAQILDAGGDLDLMIDAWEKVAALADPRQLHAAHKRLVVLYAERADFHASLDDLEAAEKDYLHALAIDPQDALLHARYGALLIAADPGRAQAQFAEVDLHSDDAAFTLLNALHQAGQHADAAYWLEKLTALRKVDGALLIELGADLFAKAPDRAIVYFDKATGQATDRERPALLTTLAVLYAAHGKQAEAITHIQRALKLDAAFGPAHLNLGLWEAARGRRREAHDHLEKAQQWAQRLRRRDIADGIEEAIDLLEVRYLPTLAEVLDSIDPDENDDDTRRLLGSISARVR